MDCGWNDGDSCAECQALLMESIQSGKLTFPAQSWTNISEEAKHLVCHLLERDADKRFTAQEVLAHDWLKTGPHTRSIPLDTPGVLWPKLADQRGAWANIPPKKNRKDSFAFSQWVYRQRNLVESHTSAEFQPLEISAMPGTLATANFPALYKVYL